MRDTAFRFRTSTATFCLFDVSALQHRLQDDPDWWSDPGEEVSEVNQGNVLFVDIGQDGDYSVLAHEGPYRGSAAQRISARIRCPSGELFLGPGEDVPGGGVLPDQSSGGTFVPVEPGRYQVTVGKTGAGALEVALERTLDAATNDITDSISIA